MNKRLEMTSMPVANKQLPVTKVEVAIGRLLFIRTLSGYKCGECRLPPVLLYPGLGLALYKTGSGGTIIAYARWNCNSA